MRVQAEIINDLFLNIFEQRISGSELIKTLGPALNEIFLSKTLEHPSDFYELIEKYFSPSEMKIESRKHPNLQLMMFLSLNNEGEEEIL